MNDGARWSAIAGEIGLPGPSRPRRPGENESTKKSTTYVWKEQLFSNMLMVEGIEDPYGSDI